MWIEHTRLAVWVSQADTLWAFPTILLVHTFGLAFTVGANTVIALRLLGVAPRIAVAPLAGLFPFIWAGLGLSAASGWLLLIADATAKLANPYFRVKMMFVLLATGCLVLLQTRVVAHAVTGQRPIEFSSKLCALLSLACWLVAITAGRLIAYAAPT